MAKTLIISNHVIKTTLNKQESVILKGYPSVQLQRLSERSAFMMYIQQSEHLWQHREKWSV